MDNATVCFHNAVDIRIEPLECLFSNRDTRWLAFLARDVVYGICVVPRTADRMYTLFSMPGPGIFNWTEYDKAGVRGRKVGVFFERNETTWMKGLGI